MTAIEKSRAEKATAVPFEIGNHTLSLAERKELKRKLKRKIKKSGPTLVPIIKSDDPEFNHEAAQKAAQMVMDMEDGEAQLFVKMVMAEVMDETIRKNRRTLQRHLDEVVEKRLDRFKKAALSSISKGHTEEALEFAEAIAEIEEVIKAAPRNPYEFGFYQFDESDFRRDPRTGRFQTKVKQPTGDRAKRPLGDKAAQAALGINTKAGGYNKLSPEKKAQFQAEYAQVVNFLNMAQGMGGSDSRVAVQVEDQHGRRYWRDLNGAPKANDWDVATGEKVVAVEARPSGGLTLGGASYGLVSGLGAEGVRRINTADQKIPSFADDWSRDDYNPRNSNERLYSRTKTGSQLIMDMTDERSKTHAAARFGRAVGEHGQSAEKVFGPPTRKAMYRYRGTEKKPDAEVLREYNLQTQRANQPGLDVAQRAKERAAITRARNAYRRQVVAEHNAKPENKKAGKGLTIDAVKIPREIDAQILQAAKKQAAQVETAPLSEEAKGAGREVLVRHLMDRERAPDKNLYNLQLESGVTPPSEGFILDKNGKVLTQAVGYGDDHYLPFNLKNLKGLRGGEYIRTRSVGGPTAEDIYTGLMAGAKQITVVSRSGTFTVEFEQDFHGKRRYNDKAFRMVRRYEKLLDTVQSETVERNVRIDPGIRQIITRQVRDEGFDRTEIRGEVRNRIQQYKDELNSITDEGELQEYVEEFIGARAEAAGSDLTTEEKNKLAGQLRNDWQSQNEYKFRLNGRGYADAMKALQEQFPYYFKTRYVPTRELERIETEKDKGYVEPGRNRPTAARGGLFGTAANQEGEVGSQKFSASQADYQRGRGLKGKNTAATGRAGVPSPSMNEGTVSDTPAAKDEENKHKESQNKRDKIKFEAAGAKLHQEVKSGLTDKQRQEYKVNGVAVFDLNEDEAREWLKDGKNAERFIELYERQKATWRDADAVSSKTLRDFEEARGNYGRVDFDPKLAHSAKRKFNFPGNAYKRGEQYSTLRETEMKKIANRTRPISVDKRLNQMSESELHSEIEMLSQIYETVRDEQNASRLRMSLIKDWEIRESNVARVNSVEKINRALEDVHRTIRLRELGVGTEAIPERSSTTRHQAPAEGSAESKLDSEQESRRRKLLQLQKEFAQAGEYYSNQRGMQYREQMMDEAADIIDTVLEGDFYDEDSFKQVTDAIGKDREKWRQFALLHMNEPKQENPQRPSRQRTKNITTKKDE